MAEDIVCILVRQPDGTDVWVPRDDYYRNPTPLTFQITERGERNAQPIIDEHPIYWKK